MSARKKFILSLITLAGVYLVGTAGYVVIERDQRPTLAKAAYMTAITLSTVGYGEAWALSPAGEMWTCCVIVFGVGTASVAFTSLTTLFVSGEIRSLRGRRKVEMQLKELRNHVIVCGYGRMGAWNRGTR